MVAHSMRSFSSVAEGRIVIAHLMRSVFDLAEGRIVIALLLRPRPLQCYITRLGIGRYGAVLRVWVGLF